MYVNIVIKFSISSVTQIGDAEYVNFGRICPCFLRVDDA